MPEIMVRFIAIVIVAVEVIAETIAGIIAGIKANRLASSEKSVYAYATT